MYYLKLHHLVNDKIHARSTGPYSLVTQQPRAARRSSAASASARWKFGRWKHTRRRGCHPEILTVKSDDITGPVIQDLRGDRQESQQYRSRAFRNPSRYSPRAAGSVSGYSGSGREHGSDRAVWGRRRRETASTRPMEQAVSGADDGSSPQRGFGINVPRKATPISLHWITRRGWR